MDFDLTFIPFPSPDHLLTAWGTNTEWALTLRPQDVHFSPETKRRKSMQKNGQWSLDGNDNDWYLLCLRINHSVGCRHHRTHRIIMMGGLMGTTTMRCDDGRFTCVGGQSKLTNWWGRPAEGKADFGSIQKRFHCVVVVLFARRLFFFSATTSSSIHGQAQLGWQRDDVRTLSDTNCVNS